MVASGLNKELISDLMLHLNQCVCKKLDHVNGTFVVYKWTNISMALGCLGSMVLY